MQCLWCPNHVRNYKISCWNNNWCDTGHWINFKIWRGCHSNINISTEPILVWPPNVSANLSSPTTECHSLTQCIVLEAHLLRRYQIKTTITTLADSNDGEHPKIDSGYQCGCIVSPKAVVFCKLGVVIGKAFHKSLPWILNMNIIFSIYVI